MAYQEVKTTSYGTRVGNSFKGIGTGIILFIAATVLLWWNEGRAVKTTKMLNEAEKAYVEMENPSKKDAALDGELVHATALATTQDSLVDARFGFGATAISLQRSVEYYQWVEHAESKSEDKLGGKEVTTTTYTYSKEWVSSPIQSESFKDPDYQNKNMVLTVVEPETQWAENVSFGAYKLNESLIHSISSREPVALAIDENILKDLNDGISRIQKKDSLSYVHQDGNVLYIGRVPSSPEVGDVRITWEKVVPAKVTIISQVDGDTFKPFKAKNGKTFQTLVMGKKDASEIFESEHSGNKMLLWVFRILGILLVIAGLKGIFGFLETILKVVPFLANILGWGVGLVCTVVGLVWSLIVIALAWVTYRPVLGVSLLVLAAFLIWVFAFKGKDKLKQLAGKAPAQPGEQA
ncbi:MAG: TMEM43 family protein [Bacteroidales bacterium]|nr:TMEM43 family protein [Bacteroidales bacterium]